MSSVRNKDTAAELVVRSLLHRLGFRFRLGRRDLPGSPDIVLPKYRVVVFVHGCFWHGHRCPRGKLPIQNRSFWEAKIRKNRLRDRRAIRQLKAAGWTPMVVWTCKLSSLTKITELGHRLAVLIPQAGAGGPFHHGQAPRGGLSRKPTSGSQPAGTPR